MKSDILKRVKALENLVTGLTVSDNLLEAITSSCDYIGDEQGEQFVKSGDLHALLNYTAAYDWRACNE